MKASLVPVDSRVLIADEESLESPEHPELVSAGSCSICRPRFPERPTETRQTPKPVI